MSSGMMSDWEDTKQQVKNPKPVKDGRTWLRHNTSSQSGQIDLMILVGTYSIDEMVQALIEQKLLGPDYVGKKGRKRVMDHILHLQEGDARNRTSGMQPHSLKLIGINDKWSFDVRD